MSTQNRSFSKVPSFLKKRINFGIIVLLVTILLLVFSKPVLAANLQCDNRFLTLVNPVRSRNLWVDKSLKPIEDQYQAVVNRGLPATWLLQYDVLADDNLISNIRQFNSQQEEGIFLEISPDLAQDARVLYPQQTPWFKPNAVFLSGYSQSERRKLIDVIFKKFHQTFGTYPKSVGAWWIDSYSLQYMQQKYDISSAMIVADQLSTDNYGVWGQWWGLSYYPAKNNILEPANSIQNKLPVAVIQWAQRDPVQAYGDSKSFSNYSIQANDYSTQGLKTDYFQKITSAYLNCSHKLGQITVGLETGQESVLFIDEYGRQLNYLQTLPTLKAITLSNFATQFARVYPQFPKFESLNYQQSQWNFTTRMRSNDFLHDQIFYNQNLSFADYFVPDHQMFLDRKLPLKNQTGIYFPIWVLVGLGGILFFGKKKLTSVGVSGFLFGLSSYGLILESYFQNGWKVYFGPQIDGLLFVQIGLVLVGFAVGLGWWKLVKGRGELGTGCSLLLIGLVFGLDPVIESIRYTKLEGQTYLGFLTDTFHFIGVSGGKNYQLVNQDFSPLVAGALLKIDFGKIWLNTWDWLIIYPLIHLLIALILFFILQKLPVIIKQWIWVGLGVFWIIFFLNLLGRDPILVESITQSGLLSLIQ